MTARPAAAVVGVLLSALAPAVEVNLEYDDPQRNVQERMTLVFTANEPQDWFVPVPEVRRNPA